MPRDGGRRPCGSDTEATARAQSTGCPARNRSTSSANSSADPYRLAGSLAIALRTIASRSPRSRRDSYGQAAEPSRAGAPGLSLDHNRDDFVDRLAVGVVRPHARQELVEHHAERIQIARSRNGQTADLLGAGVVRRHRTQRATWLLLPSGRAARAAWLRRSRELSRDLRRSRRRCRASGRDGRRGGGARSRRRHTVAERVAAGLRAALHAAGRTR